MVVGPEPLGGNLLDLLDAFENVQVQPFVPDRPVVALNIGVRTLSDNGISISRPLLGIIATIVFGWPIFTSFFNEFPVELNTNSTSAGLTKSITNTLPFLRSNNNTYEIFSQNAPTSLEILSYTQTTLGIALLFLLGLGLRNKFRIK